MSTVNKLDQSVSAVLHNRALNSTEKLIAWWLISYQSANEVRFEEVAGALGLRVGEVQNSIPKLARFGVTLRDLNRVVLAGVYRKEEKGGDSEQVRKVQGERAQESSIRRKTQALKRALALKGGDASDDRGGEHNPGPG